MKKVKLSEVLKPDLKKLDELSLDPILKNEVWNYIQTLTNRIVEKIDPEKVILFGSYAYGNPTSKSDIDLLIIIQESTLSRTERAGQLYIELKELSKYPKDLVIYTINEVKKWENVRQAFITSIIKRGKVLYERKN